MVLVLSLLNLTSFNTNTSLSNAVSFVGILTSILYWAKVSFAYYLFYFWIIIQIIVIKPHLDAIQTFRFTIFLGNIEINIFALLLLGLAKFLQAPGIIGKRIKITEFREGMLRDILPMEGVIVGRKDFKADSNWLIFQPDDAFSYDGRSAHQILFKRKDGKNFRPGKEEQIIYFRIAFSDITTENSNLNDFPFVEWAKAR